MNISLPETATILTLLGAALLLIGMIGGGFEVREIRVPKVGGVGRAAAVAVGVFFIAAGVGMEDAENPGSVSADNGPSAVHTWTPPAQPEPVEFMVFDELGEDQVSEQVTLIIDDKRYGTLTVDEHHPESSLRVTVPGSGRYSYTVDAQAIFSVDGERFRRQGTGQGMINVQAGKDFELRASSSGDTWNVVLMELER